MTRWGNAELILIRGLPGSEKSTIARTMKSYKHFEGDRIGFKSNDCLILPVPAGSIRLTHMIAA